MRKKVLSLLLICVLVLSLAACGTTQTDKPNSSGTQTSGNENSPADTSSEDKEIRLIFAWWGNQVRNDRTQEVLDLYTEKNPTITFDSQPASFADYWAKLATSAAGNDLPDIMQTNYTAYLKQYVSNNLLLNFDSYTQSGQLDISSFAQGILDSGSINGSLYAICCGLNVPSCIYNKTLTDEIGLTIDYNMTTNQFIDVCREIYEKTGVRTDLAYGNATSMMPYVMRGEGVFEIFNEDSLNVSDEDAFVPFFEIYETGYNEGWMLDAGVYAELTVNSVEQAPLVFFSSPSTQSWSACFWSNQLTAMDSAAPEGMELEYTNWPSVDPKKSDFLHPSMFFSVAQNSEYPEESVAVVDYLINSLDCNNILLGERGTPATSVVANALAESLSDFGKKEVAFINDIVTPNSSTISPVEPEGATEVYALADQLVEKVLYGVMTAEEASAELYKQGNTIMAN